MNAYTWVICGLIVASAALSIAVERLNLRRMSPDIPSEFAGLYDAAKYAQSQRYHREGARFEEVRTLVSTVAVLAFLLLGGLRLVDGWARAAGFGLIGTGLLFTGILLLLGQLMQLPFQVYDTFRIEASYGFNKTTPATFVKDLLLGMALAALLGGPLLAGILWFFSRAQWAWLWSLLAVVGWQLAVLYIYPVWIMPLFNKFTPLPEGELRTAIEDYARRQEFAMAGIFTIDGSKRSTKANAFFTGFGRHRRIALYDTLVEKHTVPELVAVLAHEIGHYKRRHVHRMLAAGVASTALMFYLLGLLIAHPGLYAAFGLDPARLVGGRAPIYIGLVLFSLLYSPLSEAIGVGLNALSRKHEFEADAFAAQTTGASGAMVDALKKLSVDNLSNLTPHPLKVFLEYSHPPVLRRIEALRASAL